jgi:hypothetical protein
MRTMSITLNGFHEIRVRLDLTPMHQHMRVLASFKALDGPNGAMPVC